GTRPSGHRGGAEDAEARGGGGTSSRRPARTPNAKTEWQRDRPHFDPSRALHASPRALSALCASAVNRRVIARGEWKGHRLTCVSNRSSAAPSSSWSRRRRIISI